jgi:Kef-type K+ transport system membrane component KefB
MLEREVIYLIFITLGVFLVPFIVPLFRLPVAVGELLFGIFLVYLFKNFGIDPSELKLLNFLSFLGFSLLMFLAGLEIDWNKLEELSAREKFVITVVVLFNFLLGGLAVYFLKLPPQFVFLLGALGIGLMLSVLREIEIDEHTKQIILITGSLGEVATLVGLTGYDIYLSFGFSQAFLYHLGLVLLFGVAFVILLKVIKFLIWLFPEAIASLIVNESKAAIDIRTSFALMLLFMSFTSLVHIEPILGAFIAGTLLGFIFREKETFEEKLSALGYGFLIPFFFVHVGFNFDLSTLKDLELLKTTAVLWVAIFLVKGFSSLWFKLTGFSFKQILLAALLFSFPFTILIAVAKILFEKGVWSAEQFSMVILLTILTSIFYPLAVKILFGEKNG